MNLSRIIRRRVSAALALAGLLFAAEASAAKTGDFNNDAKVDYTVWRPSTGVWYSVLSNGGQVTERQWGAPTDVPVPADYDGDGKTDIAVWRPSDGHWLVIKSTDGQIIERQWGAPTDVTAPGDYDGDGKADIAVWRPFDGKWFVIKSTDGQIIERQWGAPTDIPVPGDYDGDGKTDIAVFRPFDGKWFVIKSSNGQIVERQWGLSSDVLVPADYDGDGKTDFAVFRPSTGNWHIIYSWNGQQIERRWGDATNVPVPADYDGDGKADIAVWRPADGIWTVNYSWNGQTATRQWGARTDLPVTQATSGLWSRQKGSSMWNREQPPVDAGYGNAGGTRTMPQTCNSGVIGEELGRSQGSFGDSTFGAGYDVMAGLGSYASTGHQRWMGAKARASASIFGASADIIDIGAEATRDGNAGNSHAWLRAAGATLFDQSLAPSGTSFSFTQSVLGGELDFYVVTVHAEAVAAVGIQGSAILEPNGITLDAMPYADVWGSVGGSAGAWCMSAGMDSDLSFLKVSLPAAGAIAFNNGNLTSGSWSFASSASLTPLRGWAGLYISYCLDSESHTLFSWDGLPTVNIPLVSRSGCL